MTAKLNEPFTFDVQQKVLTGNNFRIENIDKQPEVLFITSYPPRECGIATYSHDLIKALNKKFNHSFKISICPIEADNEHHFYTDNVRYLLNSEHTYSYLKTARAINEDDAIQMVLIQHEFGFFKKNELDFQQFLDTLTKPVIIVFHTVLPNPDEPLKIKVKQIAEVATSVIVMTNCSAKILAHNYGIPNDKITVIPHGTHLVPHSDKELLKDKYNLTGKKILSTFGLLSSGKSIETTLEALPAIVEKDPDVLFLIIGKTHPTVVKHEGEQYRTMLEQKIAEMQLTDHVQFVNYFLPLPELLEYLQLTDIYLFTSKDPNQAVSGTFSYAISCGCPIISTPIPHAREVLQNDAGVIIDFNNSRQLTDAVLLLLEDEQLRSNISSNGIHRIASTAWENAAIAHAMLFEKIGHGRITLRYNIPVTNLDHIKRLTTDFGMIQFSKINHPDISSGYTLDDNARAMIAMCLHFGLTGSEASLKLIITYFSFIKHCLQPDGNFLNYLDGEQNFTEQNTTTNLADANGRAIWALGYMVSLNAILPEELIEEAEQLFQKALRNVTKIHSTRAMAFVIKGLYYCNTKNRSEQNISLIKVMANRLLQMYRHEADEKWYWFESYLTYANSIIPEAMLCAWLATGEPVYKAIARSSFDFLLSKIFSENSINVISNKSWSHRGVDSISKTIGGEQPIDVAYTILALSRFYNAFKNEDHRHKMDIAFNWFLGNNHLHQVIYNPCTGGCYDGLEDSYVNLNQGAESTVSYLMARLTIEKTLRKQFKKRIPRTLLFKNKRAGLYHQNV